MGDMDDLKRFVIAGDLICLTVLVCVAVAQLLTDHLRSACINFGLAAFTVVAYLPLLSSVRIC